MTRVAISPRDERRDPLDVAAAWPTDQPLMLVHSGRPHDRHARWSILASPCGVLSHDRESSWHPLRQTVRCPAPLTGDPVRDLDAVLAATRVAPTTALPFSGGWIVVLGYELGRLIEPAVTRAAEPLAPSGWPRLEAAWCPDALVFEHAPGRWHAVGAPPLSALTNPPAAPASPVLGHFSPSIHRHQHCANVARTVEYIAAGDVFQANITQTFTAVFEGSSRQLAIDALRSAQPWYGAYLELPDGRAVLSMSPELFLAVDPHTREVTTRPIKGTRPSTVAPSDLLASEKDAAELHMIVDLMRNDLGRVAETGSVRVTSSREIETHPTVHHGVAEVTARLRPDVSMGDLLRATFPPGSVTGAPKIRAMQIIEELERAERGPYCGSIGFVSDDGRAILNVAIRTMLLRGETMPGSLALGRGTISYGVGGGVVADSDPQAEYEECLDKARVLDLIGPASS